MLEFVLEVVLALLALAWLVLMLALAIKNKFDERKRMRHWTHTISRVPIGVTNSIANQHTHRFTVRTCGRACTGRVGSAFGYIENIGIVAVDVILLLLDLSNHPCHLARRRLKPTIIRNLQMQEEDKGVRVQVDIKDMQTESLFNLRMTSCYFWDQHLAASGMCHQVSSPRNTLGR